MKSFLSKNAVKRLMQLILGKMKEKEDVMEEVGSDEVELLYKYEIAPEGELDNWEYNLDEYSNIVSLSKYKGTQENVVVYDKYRYNGKLYDTKLTAINFDETLLDDDINIIKSYHVCDNVIEEFSEHSIDSGFSGLQSIEIINFGSNFNTTGVTNINYMFSGCTSLHTIIGLENFDVSAITDAQNVFDGCESLKDISGVYKWNLKNVNDISGIFSGLKSIETLDLSNFAISNGPGTGPINMNGMFQDCSNLKTLILPTDPNKFNTENCTDMTYFFAGCSSLTNLDLTNFNTSKVESMSNMFQGCTLLESINLSSFNTSNVTDMQSMFNSCSTLTELDLTSFDTSSIFVIFSMFQDCSNLTKILVGDGWNIDHVSFDGDMFTGCGVQEVTVAS